VAVAAVDEAAHHSSLGQVVMVEQVLSLSNTQTHLRLALARDSQAQHHQAADSK
jgi:hypothetical protein